MVVLSVAAINRRTRSIRSMCYIYIGAKSASFLFFIKCISISEFYKPWLSRASKAARLSFAYSNESRLLADCYYKCPLGVAIRLPFVPRVELKDGDCSLFMVFIPGPSSFDHPVNTLMSPKLPTRRRPNRIQLKDTKQYDDNDV